MNKIKQLKRTVDIFGNEQDPLEGELSPLE